MAQDQLGQNPYYSNMDNMRNVDNMPNQMSQNFGQNPYFGSVNAMPQQQNNSSLLGSFDTENFIKGALIGAIGAYLLTNEKAQKTIFKGVVKTTGMFQSGMEEMKERFEDAKAELDAES
ncbi:MAG: YtxH domain-containing protein [Sulfurovum sp.]|nr:YtxH domain-containing protein [Sulfurovum sp.]